MSKIVFKGLKAELDEKEEGRFKAIFSTFDVVDLDGDLTKPGAFDDGAPVRVAQWGHNWGALPAGRGTIHTNRDEAWVEGEFFMDTNHGLDTYRTVKGLGPLQEWSYGFDIIDGVPVTQDGKTYFELRKLKVHEVSPVMLGAGIGTRTETIKSGGAKPLPSPNPNESHDDFTKRCMSDDMMVSEWPDSAQRYAVCQSRWTSKAAIGSHHTDTTDSAWDGPESVSRLKNDETTSYYRKMFAWIDTDADPATKGAYKFPHHTVSESGEIGAANLVACSAGIAILNGGRGGANIPSDDKQGVWNHLASHIRDADKEPPPLKANWGFTEHGLWVVQEAQEFVERASKRFEFRSGEGRKLSKANKTTLEGLMEAISGLQGELGKMLEEGQQPKLRSLAAMLQEAESAAHSLR